ncbi:MAG: hypothetical protein R3B48_13815 [Kofleriaceae bacterium]
MFRGAVADLVQEALDALSSSAPSAGDGATSPSPVRVAIVGDVALGRALRNMQRRELAAHPERPARELIIVVEPEARVARKLDGLLRGPAAAIPLEDGALDALVGVGALTADPASPKLAEWMRVVRPGGGVVLVDRVARTQATRLALCAGLTELEQRAAARAVVTSGRVASLELMGRNG